MHLYIAKEARLLGEIESVSKEVNFKLRRSEDKMNKIEGYK